MGWWGAACVIAAQWCETLPGSGLQPTWVVLRIGGIRTHGSRSGGGRNQGIRGGAAGHVTVVPLAGRERGLTWREQVGRLVATNRDPDLMVAVMDIRAPEVCIK